MKPTLSLLLALLLTACSYHPANTAAEVIGDKVKACCSSMSMAKEAQKLVPAHSTEKTDAVSISTSSLLDRTANILTW
jgi:hypothetical protein